MVICFSNISLKHISSSYLNVDNRHDLCLLFSSYEKLPESWSRDNPQSVSVNCSRPVTCYIEDVVSTYKIMMNHKPKWAEDELPPRPFFLTDIKNPTSRTVVSWILLFLYKNKVTEFIV